MTNKSNEEYYDNWFKIGLEYFIWGGLILNLSLVFFGSFKVDLFHILGSVVIFALLLALYFTRKFKSISVTRKVSVKAVKAYLRDKYPTIFF